LSERFTQRDISSADYFIHHTAKQNNREAAAAEAAQTQAYTRWESPPTIKDNREMNDAMQF